MKIQVLTLTCALLFTACAGPLAPAASSSPAQQSQPSQSAAASAAPDTAASQAAFSTHSYPIAAHGWARPWAWIDGGTLLAAENGGTVRYLDMRNNVVATATIDPQYLTDDYQLVYGEDKIFIAQSSGPQSNQTYLYKTDDVWQLYNGSVHGRDGTLVRAFPALTSIWDESSATQRYWTQGVDITEDTEGHVVSISRPVWIDRDTLALWGFRSLFFYNVTTDTLTLVDDFNDELPPAVKGTDGGWYQIDAVIPFGGGCLYSVFDVPESITTNSTSHVYFTDGKTVRRPAFGGEIFTYATGEPDAVAVVARRNNDAHTETLSTQCRIATPALGEYTLPDFAGGVRLGGVFKSEQNSAVTRFVFCADFPEAVFYVCEVNGTQVSQCEYRPQAEGRQFELVSVSGSFGALTYVFSARTIEDGTPVTYRYEEATDTLTQLSRHYTPATNFCSGDGTVFVDLFPDTSEPTSLQIVSLE